MVENDFKLESQLKEGWALLKRFSGFNRVVIMENGSDSLELLEPFVLDVQYIFRLKVPAG
ncbi:hypothetical protein CUU63_02655 [Bacillus halotolerans]|uniref:Uncharacterized protein n=1 Tax=Bacillus halotolerans TaxID=260554 RepID=A0A9Q6ACQ4_9BACI|nr:hypothetical protein CUU63_02655 [Bacillus halotolerans]